MWLNAFLPFSKHAFLLVLPICWRMQRTCFCDPSTVDLVAIKALNQTAVDNYAHFSSNDLFSLSISWFQRLSFCNLFIQSIFVHSSPKQKLSRAKN